MARWDRADLTRQCRTMSGRPAADADMTKDLWWDLLTQGQDHWAEVIATHVPAAMYGAPVELAPNVDRSVWTLPGTGDIIGRVELRQGSAWGDKVDSSEYVQEGRTVRVRHGKRASLFARFVAAPGAIDAQNEPSLQPERARILVVYHACALEASRGGMKDPAPFLALAQKTWIGDPLVPGDVGLLEALQKQYREESTSGRRWIYPPPRI